MWYPFEIVGIMPAHLEDAGFLAFPFERFKDVRTTHCHPLGDGRAGQVLTGLEEMLDFPENPWIANGRTANHDAIHLVLHAPCGGLFHAVHITVAENRNPDARIALDFADEVPVGLALVHL